MAVRAVLFICCLLLPFALCASVSSTKAYKRSVRPSTRRPPRPREEEDSGVDKPRAPHELKDYAGWSLDDKQQAKLLKADKFMHDWWESHGATTHLFSVTARNRWVVPQTIVDGISSIATNEHNPMCTEIVKLLDPQTPETYDRQWLIIALKGDQVVAASLWAVVGDTCVELRYLCALERLPSRLPTSGRALVLHGAIKIVALASEQAHAARAERGRAALPRFNPCVQLLPLTPRLRAYYYPKIGFSSVLDEDGRKDTMISEPNDILRMASTKNLANLLLEPEPLDEL